MGSLAQSSQLPVINLSTANLKLGSASWTSVSDRVRNSLEEHGCFVAVYDQIPPELQARVFEVLKDLFDLPAETKAQNVSKIPFHGYIGQQAVIPLHQSLGIERSTTSESLRNFTNLMWPSGNEFFQETIFSYSNQVAELEQLVVRMMCESYGVNEYYERHKETTNYLLRVMKYRGPKENETNAGLTPHTDKSFLTVLNQNQVNGLEVKTKDGEWICYQPFPSYFVVMAGDAAMAWSNGRIHSPHHRVTIKSNNPRYTTGLFSYNQGIIEVPEKLVDAEHPRRFNAFDHYGLLRFFATPAGMTSPCTATAYCGA
ncbi:unnamed protein product [Rhodiola kirilowii]